MDEIYKKMKSGNPSKQMQLIDIFCQDLGKNVGEFLQSDWRHRIKYDFLAVFFEMCLTSIFLSHTNFEVQPNNKSSEGPDFHLKNNDMEIMVEATTISQGTGNDRIPDIIPRMVQDVDAEKMQLRLTNALLEKLKQYKKWKSANSTISYVISISMSKLSGSCVDVHADDLILGAFYPVGKARLKWSTAELEYEYQEYIKKQNKSMVSKMAFLDDKYSIVSAVLISRSGCINYVDLFDKYKHGYTNPREMVSNDLILIHNHRAAHPLPKRIFNTEAEYFCQEENDSFQLVRL